MTDPTDWLLDCLGTLARRRLVFHSEADLQFALAWEVQTRHPGVEVRLEVPSRTGTGREALDVLLRWPGGHETALELKYPKASWIAEIEGEPYALPTTSAHDLVRHDIVKDVGRLERWVSAEDHRDGFVVVVSNDSALWRVPARGARSIDEAFRLHDGAVLTGRREWAEGAGATTIHKRDRPIDLVGKYTARWRAFSALPGQRNTEMRVLLLRVDVPVGSAPSVETPEVGPAPATTEPPEVAFDPADHALVGPARTDETIWQKLERCVGVLSEPFTRQEIVSWFRRHEPDVLEQSLSQHIQMATAGKGTGIYAGRTPLLERIDRGLYRRYRPKGE